MQFKTREGKDVQVKISSTLVHTDSARQDSATVVQLCDGRWVKHFVVVHRTGMAYIYAQDHLEGGPRPPWAILHDGERWLPFLVVDHIGAWTPSGDEPNRDDWTVQVLEQAFLQ